jgi:hypothetical protein
MRRKLARIPALRKMFAVSGIRLRPAAALALVDRSHREPANNTPGLW